jgi:hypothetical protein
LASSLRCLSKDFPISKTLYDKDLIWFVGYFVQRQQNGYNHFNGFDMNSKKKVGMKQHIGQSTLHETKFCRFVSWAKWKKFPPSKTRKRCREL